jgi:Family of unknown function (DUF6433)
MHLSISEILAQADDAPLFEDKVYVLRNNYSKPLVHVLQAAFDDRIKFLLPEGPVPYRGTRAIGQEGNLYQEARRLYLFVKGGHPTLSQRRREDLFIQLLENLDHKDADLLVHIKDKKLPYPTITYEVFKAAFPDVDCVHDSTKPRDTVNEIPVEAKIPIPSNIEWNDVPPAAILFGEGTNQEEQQAVDNIIDQAANEVLAETEAPKKKRGRPKGTTKAKKTTQPTA